MTFHLENARYTDERFADDKLIAEISLVLTNSGKPWIAFGLEKDQYMKGLFKRISQKFNQKSTVVKLKYEEKKTSTTRIKEEKQV